LISRALEGWSRGLAAAAAVLMVLAVLAVALYAPIEREQGLPQKIFYLHVPSAWVMFLAFFFVFIGSVRYLWKKDPAWDTFAYCCAELGVLFCTLVLATGPVWGKATWGAWWTWDPRLTLTLILWLIYSGYLILRASAASEEQAARFGAVLGIVGFADVPLIHFSVLWWRGMHPAPVIGLGGVQGGGLHPAMLYTLLLSLVAFTALFLSLLGLRIPLRRAEMEMRDVRRLSTFTQT